MLADHFRFEFLQPFKGQCVFGNISSSSPIYLDQEITGWAIIFADIKDTKMERLPYFSMAVRGPENVGTYTPVVDFLIHNFIGIEDRSCRKIFSNDFLYDHETDMIGSIERINHVFYFLPSNTKDLSSNGRKRLTDGSNWSIFGNSVEGELV